MNEITYSPPHPVIFVFDFDNKSVIIPEYDPQKVVSSNAMCLSIHTVADVDGDVTAILDFEKKVHHLNLVFEGKVSIPSGNIALVNSENKKLLEVKTTRTSALVRVSVDDVRFPERVVIGIG